MIVKERTAKLVNEGDWLIMEDEPNFYNSYQVTRKERVNYHNSLYAFKFTFNDSVVGVYHPDENVSLVIVP